MNSKEKRVGLGLELSVHGQAGLLLLGSSGVPDGRGSGYVAEENLTTRKQKRVMGRVFQLGPTCQVPTTIQLQPLEELALATLRHKLWQVPVGGVACCSASVSTGDSEASAEGERERE